MSDASHAAILSLRNKILWTSKRPLLSEDEVDEARPADASQGDPNIIAAARSSTFASGDTLRLPKGFAVVGVGVDTQPAIEPRAQAIRDCIEANRLQHRAAAVLGYDAVSELMSELPGPDGEAVAPETEAESGDMELADDPSDPAGSVRHIGTLIPWSEDDPEEAPLLPEDITQELDTGRIIVTRDGLSYVTQTGFRAFRKWLPLAGLKGPHYDLAAVERWLGDQVSLPVKITRLCKEDLSRALRGIQGYRAEVERLEQQPALSAQAITKALQAAIALEKASTKIGWEEIERITGLRPAPRYAGRRA